MAIQTTYTHACENLAELFDEVTLNHEIVIIHREGKADVACISASDLISLMETAHLLHSPANANRLFSALNRARAYEGEPQSIDELRREVGLDE